jgi:hypothetical protein
MLSSNYCRFRHVNRAALTSLGWQAAAGRDREGKNGWTGVNHMVNRNHEELADSRIEMILRALEGLEYGTLHIVVHESQITQIERTEKTRFPLERAAVKSNTRQAGRGR